MIISTTAEIHGRNVERYLGLVFGEIVLGTSFFADVAAGWTDFFGSRSGAYEQKMLQARSEVLSKIVARAGELGADAILGIRLDYETIGQNMIMLCVSGTAVRLDPDASTAERASSQARKADLWSYWNDTANAWQDIDEYLGKVTEPVTAEILRVGAVGGGKTVLDVGCGTGDATIAVARAAGGGTVFGLDVSQTMLRLTQAKARGVSNLELLVEDIQECANVGRAADIAICRFSLPLVDDPGAALARLHGLLKPGGRLVVAVWGPPAANSFLSAPVQALETLGVSGLGPMSRSFAMSDQVRLTGVFATAGFKNCSFTSVEMTLQALNFYRYWNFIRQYFSDIGMMPATTQDSVRTEIARMMAIGLTNPLSFKAQALVCSATS